jgi:hypothetical protein
LRDRLAAAMLLTSGGFGFAAIYPGRCRAPIGGGIIGGGIACMHYLGMWALEVPGRASAARSLSDISGDVSPSRKNDKSRLTRAARSIAALRLWRETMARFRTEAASRSAAAASEIRIATRLARSIFTKDVKSASGSCIVFAQGLGGRLKNLSRRQCRPNRPEYLPHQPHGNTSVRGLSVGPKICQPVGANGLAFASCARWVPAIARPRG